MGKTIKLTEEQIRRFFGEGFSRRLIGEGYKEKDPNGIKLQNKDLYKTAYDKSKVKGYNSGKGNFFSGMNYGDKISKSFPGKTDARIKMYDLGLSSIMPKENAYGAEGNAIDFNTGNNDEILKALYEMNGNNAIGLLDALRIFMKINNKEFTEKDVNNDVLKNFLNGFNIVSILSNFLKFRCPDYVYFRLLNLSKDEIDTIETEYGKDFSNWGKKCDGCGITKWKTNVFPNTHDDAHINLEYMGGERAYEGDRIQEEKEDDVDSKIDTRQAEKNKTSTRVKAEEYPVPFQIHHMNENTSDNSPLNLDCLCPNCHAITGSYGLQKNGIDSDMFNFLKDFTDVKGGSILSSMSQNEVDMLANSIKNGDFESMRFTNSAYKLSDEASDDEVKNGIQWSSIYLGPNTVSDSIFYNAGINPSLKESFIEKFNDIFYRLFDEAQELFDAIYSKKLNESSKSVKDNEDIANKVDIDNGEEEKTFVGKRSFNDKICGVDLKFELMVSKKGYIELIIFEGEEPDYMYSVSDNPITLNRMFWSPGGNEAVRLSEIKRIRTGILYMILNNIKNINNTITRIKFNSGYLRQYNGKTVVNKSKIKRTNNITDAAHGLRAQRNEREQELGELAKIIRRILSGRILTKTRNIPYNIKPIKKVMDDVGYDEKTACTDEFVRSVADKLETQQQTLSDVLKNAIKK